MTGFTVLYIALAFFAFFIYVTWFGTSIKIESDNLVCNKVVVATGAWSKKLLKKFKMKIPLESERGYHIEYINPDSYPKAPMMLTSKKFVITPMNGRIRAAGLVEFAGLKALKRKQPINLLKNKVKD